MVLKLQYHLLDNDIISLAYKEAYHLGVLHRDISSGSNVLITDDPTFDSGLLIDWDMCKVKDGQGGSSWNACMGTWQFMAADLVMDPDTTHSFVHNLESTFYVVLW
ncbi:hypothetical protein EDB85DRAFT_1859941, partial [Lactarius pseudohatsudake]